MLARAGLRTLEWPYTAAVRLRNFCYDKDLAKIHRAGVPVVSVGNLTLGGTGKTPTVEWLAHWFAEQQLRVGLVSRGYGARHANANDEAMELAHKLPGVPHVLDPDRVSGARRLVSEFGCQVVLADDGFQHRRLARDLNIVLVDASEPFGFGHVFPRGTLREPLSGWSRAGVVLLTRAELVDAPARAAIRNEVRRHAPAAIWAEATHAPESLLSSDGTQQPLSHLAGQRVAAFAGIGNPAGFRHALAACGYQVAAMREFADHFAYSARDAESLAAWANSLDVAAAICTHKDLVKIGSLWTGNKPLWALSSRLRIEAGAAELCATLLPIVERAKQPG
jgi:tetraacyldisaccharide 4'-kinase